MRRVVLVAICAVIAGCGEARQPQSAKTVAAFEVRLPSEADRDQFLSVLRPISSAAIRSEPNFALRARRNDPVSYFSAWDRGWDH
jgi:hypothetical protein